jgi:hypothetical protein
MAICTGVIDFGLQPGSAMYPKPKHQVYIRFELPDETITYTKDGEEVSGPMSIGRTFTASMGSKSNLRPFIESWFGKKFPSDDAAGAFDLSKLLGRACLLNVTHQKKGDKTYANVQAATPLLKGMVPPAQHNPSVLYSLDEPDPAALKSLPEWMQKKVASRLVEGNDDTWEKSFEEDAY